MHLRPHGVQGICTVDPHAWAPPLGDALCLTLWTLETPQQRAVCFETRAAFVVFSHLTVKYNALYLQGANLQTE